jgi:hypothetical protein
MRLEISMGPVNEERAESFRYLSMPIYASGIFLGLCPIEKKPSGLKVQIEELVGNQVI